ncbi:luciferin sulfotransferase-like [Phlebotomus argentipes]|uniref:luciferin sulfotransferase-like n=1 Tax=Phlebotomus argentipes TaxID=94469 RepID=UPI0028933FD3|nr:luciferin sulfotransferase-like [Phlebotomus argentipes]
MPLICENLPTGDLARKAEYVGVSDFIRIRHTRRPNIPIAQNWCLRSYFMPAKYRESVQQIENFQVRPDDVWVVTFPKCGTTWSQEMVWMLCNDLDYDKGQSVGLNTRFPFFELGTIVGDKFSAQFGDVISGLDKMTSPRLIKSHLPAPLLPKSIWEVKPKIIYVARNVKDAAISFYHHYKNLQGYRGTFDDFLDTFLNDGVIYAPYDSHIIDFWNMRDEENILFLTYEDMKRDHPSVIRKTAEFLGKSFSDEQIETLAEHLTFDKMTKNGSVNFQEEMKGFAKLLNIKKDENFNFIRKGKVGGYHDEMTEERIEMFDSWIQERLAKYNVDPQIQDILVPTN